MANARVDDEKVVSDLRTLKLLSDPLRLRLLEAFADRPRSVKQAALRLKVPVGKLYYHIGLLERRGLLVIAATRRSARTTEKLYRVAARAFRVDRKILAISDSDAGFDASLRAILDATRAEAQRGARLGAFDENSSATLARNVVAITHRQAAVFKAEIDRLLKRFESAGTGAGDILHNLTIAYFPIEEDR